MTRPPVVRWRPSPREPPLQAVTRTVLLKPRLRRAFTRGMLALPLGSSLRRRGLEQALRVGFAYFNRGDISLSVAFHAPDAPVHTPLAGLDLETLRGGPGAARTWALWSSMWESSRRELDEIVDAGNRLLLLCTHVNVGREGLEIREPVALLFTWRGAEFGEHREFTEPAEALRIVGADVG